MPRTALVALPLLLVPALGVAQGGYQPDAWVWSGALAGWAGALALTVADSPGALGRARWWLLSACALLVWTFASALWSPEPAQSLLDARRTAVYTAYVVALAVLARGRATATLVRATHWAVALLVLYALVRYLAGGRRYDPYEAFLLSQPLGYANAVGILAVLAIVLALAEVASGRRTAVALAGAATIPPLALALTLSQSRASWLALGAGLGVAALLHPRPLQVAGAVAAQVPPAAAAVAVGAYSRLSTTGPPRLDGTEVLLAAAGCAALAAAAAHLRVRLPVPRLPRLRGGPWPAAGFALAVAAAGAAAAGRSDPRGLYYHVAWRELVAHPLLGGGAASFGRYWREWGDPLQWGGALDAHSLYLETLAELGPLGLVLLLAFLLLPLRGALSRRAEPAVPFAAGAAVAFLVHAGLDWDWEIPAVVLAGLATLAALAFAAPPREPAPVRAPLRLAVLALALVLGGVSIVGAASGTVPGAETREAPVPGASQRDP